MGEFDEISYSKASKNTTQLAELSNEIENHHSIFYGESDPTPEQKAAMQEGDMWVKLAPFSPEQIDGLVFWLDASDLEGANGSAVETWVDKTSNGHDATFQTNAPILGVGALNDKNVVQFNTTESVTTMTIPDHADFNGLSERTVIMVAKERTNDSSAISVIRKKSGTSASYNATSHYMVIGFQQYKPYAVFALGKSTTNQAPVTPVNVWRHYLFDNKDHQEDRIFANNSLSLTIPHDGAVADNVDPIRIGGTSSGDTRKATVDIAEILFINRRLTAGERGLFAAYFNAKYGI